MTWLRCFILFALLTVSASADEQNRLTPEEQADGWLLLFDGETLVGWRAAGEAEFRVEDGRIVVSSGDVCLLRTTTQLGDYALKVDFRAAEGTNSGIFLRTSPDPAKVDRDCYELNIAPPDNPFPTGSFVQRQKVNDAQDSPDQWHSYEVTADGGRFVVRLDGRELLHYTDESPLETLRDFPDSHSLASENEEFPYEFNPRQIRGRRVLSGSGS